MFHKYELEPHTWEFPRLLACLVWSKQYQAPWLQPPHLQRTFHKNRPCEKTTNRWNIVALSPNIEPSRVTYPQAFVFFRVFQSRLNSKGDKATIFHLFVVFSHGRFL